MVITTADTQILDEALKDMFSVFNTSAHAEALRVFWGEFAPQFEAGLRERPLANCYDAALEKATAAALAIDSKFFAEDKGETEEDVNAYGEDAAQLFQHRIYVAGPAMHHSRYQEWYRQVRQAEAAQAKGAAAARQTAPAPSRWRQFFDRVFN